METTCKRLIRSVSLLGLAILLGGCGQTEESALFKDDGAWLAISEKNLTENSTGLAQIVIKIGNEQRTLEAPYSVKRHGIGGATVTLSTSCGDFPILVLQNGDADPFNETALPPDRNSIANCGLGEKLKRAGAWRLVKNWKA